MTKYNRQVLEWYAHLTAKFWTGNISHSQVLDLKHFSPTTITRILKKMIKIRGLIIPDDDKKYVSELSKVNPFTYKNIDFHDRIPLKLLELVYNPTKDDRNGAPTPSISLKIQHVVIRK